MRHSTAIDFELRDDSMIASVSHELRVPLANLKMRLYLARMQPEKAKDHLLVMEAITERMCTLVDDLLDTATLELGKLQLNRQYIAIQDVVRGVVELQMPQADQKRIVLCANLPAEPVVAAIDRPRMEQVLTNLIANAINYTPAGGEITVQIACQSDHVIIQICDTGIGISAEHLDQIFEPFFRVGHSSSKGAGLGLAISKKIVEAHGGNIRVDSKVGRGSVFSVKIPQPMDVRAGSQ